MSRRKPSPRQKYLSTQELGRLLGATPVGPEHDLLFVAANLGLRVGEVVRLRIENILPDGSILVPCLKRQASRIQPGEVPQSYETLPLLPDVRTALDRQIGEDRREGWIWPGQRGNEHHATERWAELVFARARDRAKLDKAYSFHSLRHSFGVRVYDETQDVLAVKSLLRHRAWQSSMVYAHMTDSTRQKVAARVGTVGATQQPVSQPARKGAKR